MIVFDDAYDRYMLEFGVPELPEPFDFMLEHMGPKAFCQFIQDNKSTSLYIKSNLQLFRDLIIWDITERYNGANHSQLAKDWDITQRTVRAYINEY